MLESEIVAFSAMWLLNFVVKEFVAQMDSAALNGWCPQGLKSVSIGHSAARLEAVPSHCAAERTCISQNPMCNSPTAFYCEQRRLCAAYDRSRNLWRTVGSGSGHT